jgi:hypothetical protein
VNAIVQHSPSPVATSGGNGGSLVPHNLDQAMRLAEMMSRAKMVPKHLQGDPGSCFMVVEQAQRWNMSPFAVGQCTSNIGGKMCYEGKLIAAAVSATGAITGEFDYEYEGDPLKPDTLSVKVSATRTSDGQRKEIILRWKDAKTANQYWTSQPEQQLCYAGARVWARRWTPGPLLGVYAPEEMAQAGEPAFVGVTVDAEPQTRETINAEIRMEPKRQTIAEWLDSLEKELQGACAMAEDVELVEAILARTDVQTAQTTLRNGALDRLNAMIKTAMLSISAPFSTDPAPMAQEGEPA